MTYKKPKEDMTVRECPACLAPVGEPCSRPNGKRGPFAGWAHRERVAFARLGMPPEEILEEVRRQHIVDRQHQQIVVGIWMPDGYILKEPRQEIGVVAHESNARKD